MHAMFVIYRHDFTKSWAPHTCINMVATNHALVEKHGIIPHVRLTIIMDFSDFTPRHSNNRWAESKLRCLITLWGRYSMNVEAHNGHCAMTARPRGNFVLAFGEDNTFSWASDRFCGPYVLCCQVPGVSLGYYLLTAVGFGLGSHLR